MDNENYIELPDGELSETPDRILSETPDNKTKKGLPDHTSRSADGRILYLNLGFFKYGTDDKSHAAAIVLSLLLLIIIVVVVFSGMYTDKEEWSDKVFNWLGSAFLFVTGIALGGKGDCSSKQKDNDYDR